MNPPRFLGLSFFVNPWVIFSVFLLILNDHFLKFQFGNLITGKISDFCGVFFLPLFLCAIGILTASLIGSQSVLTQRKLLIAILLTDLFFIALNLWPWFNDQYLGIMKALRLPAHSTMDPTDLLALSMNPVTFFLGKKYLSDLSSPREQ